MGSRNFGAFRIKNKKDSERVIRFLQRPYLNEASPYSFINFSTIYQFGYKSILTNLLVSKAIFIGDMAVGKTSLINKFSHRIFNTSYKATIGVDFEIERFRIMDIPFNLQIWDTAGQERFKCIAQSYYRGANVIVLVFSLCDPATLSHVNNWLNDALKTDTNSLLFLVGTKRDKLSLAEYVKIESVAVALSKQINAEYWAVSSKSGDCVINLFNRIAGLTFYKAIEMDMDMNNKHVSIGNPLALQTTFKNTSGWKERCNGCSK